MAIANLVDPVPAMGGEFNIAGCDSWMQGRTLYGGASALIAYTAARRAFPGLPALRAAQIGFVGPVGPTIEIRREIVRQGRNVTQVRSELWCEGNCALTAFWLFASARKPNAIHPSARFEPMPPPPQELEELSLKHAPRFLQENFELRRAQARRGSGPPVVRRWARIKDHEQLDPTAQILLVGDILPPGAMRVMRKQGPISSINWSFNLLNRQPETSDGWWLTENASQHADEGYSSERLRLWNSSGEQMVDGLQCVSIFG